MNQTRSRMLMLASGVGILILAGILSQRHSQPVGKTIQREEEKAGRHSQTSVLTKQLPSGQITYQPILADLTPPADPPHPPGSPDNQEWINTRIDELKTLEWQDDPISLRKVLTELRNPLPEIRAAALESTRNFGSRDAIPYLQAIANESQEPQEKVALTELIEHLKLPTLLELSEQNPAER